MRHWKTGTAALLAAALVGGSAARSSRRRRAAQNTVKLELWSRQDPSGPLRPGNVVKAAERLNKELEAEGSDKRVEVVVRESPAKGFDDDALQLLKVFGIGEGPDMFIAAHEWICAFQKEGFVLKLDESYRQISAALRHDLPLALGVGEVPRWHLWNPAGRRGAHVLLQQEAPA